MVANLRTKAQTLCLALAIYTIWQRHLDVNNTSLASGKTELVYFPLLPTRSTTETLGMKPRAVRREARLAGDLGT